MKTALYNSAKGIWLHQIFVACCLLLSLSTTAGTLKGVVRDKSGALMPYATVGVQGTTNGTAANASGAYQLTLAPGTYTITCQFISYKQSKITVTITGNETIERNFSLEDQSLQLKEYVVKATDEDPAYNIIRKTIERRPFHLKEVKALQTSIYLKGIFRNRNYLKKMKGIKIKVNGSGIDSSSKGVLYLCEEEADYYTQEPDKEKNIIHSVRESGNANGLGVSQMPAIITFYANNVTLLEGINPRGFVSPIAENALHYYTYKLQGDFQENGKTIDKIKVTPKRGYEPLFTGYIYIAEGDWAIHSLSMTTTTKNGLEMLDTARVEQVFVPLKNDTWVIKNQQLHVVFKVIGLDIAGDFVTVYNNQKVNEPLPDSIFNKSLLSVYDAGALKKDTTYWNNNRPVPLETDEVHDFKYKDSVVRVLKDPHRIDSIRRKNNRVSIGNILLNGTTINGKDYKQSFHFNSLVFAANYNTVEGLNVAPQLVYNRSLDSSNSLTLRLAERYGFNNTHFNSMASLYYYHKDRKWLTRGWDIGVEGGKYVYQYNPDNPIQPIFNTFSTLVYNQNYMKLYERYSGAVIFNTDRGNGWKWNAKLDFQKRMPLNNTTDYSWANSKHQAFTSNLPQTTDFYHPEEHNAALVHVDVSYQPGYKYIQYPEFKRPEASNKPILSVAYDGGIPDILNSKTNFNKWRAGIEGEQGLKLFGTINYNISAGGFFNSDYIGLPDMKQIDGNRILINSASNYMHGFLIAPYYLYSNTAQLYGEAHTEYNLQGLITNKIPLLRQAQWYFILGNNTYYSGSKDYYTEAFVSVDNLGYKLVRFLRVDLVKSWDGMGRNSTGIRLGLRTGGLIGLARGDNGEW